MITNEEFKICTDLCVRRSALIKLSKEVNDIINNPPTPNEDLKKIFYQENKTKSPYWESAIVTYIIVCVIGGIISFLTESGGMAALTIVTGIVLSTIMGARGQSKYKKKIKNECDKMLEENTEYSNEYYRILPKCKNFRNDIRESISDVTDEIRSMNAIPEKYWDVASELWYFVTVHEAEDYREAVRIWEDIQHKMAVENLAREQVHYAQVAADYAEESREYAYQSMISSQNSERNSDISLLLNTYTAYKVS